MCPHTVPASINAQPLFIHTVLLGAPSIRTKALSRREYPERCASTACLVWPELSLRTKTLETSLANHIRWTNIVPPTIDTAFDFSHDSSMRTSSRRAGAKVENGFFVFQGAYFAPSFARASLDARAPNQFRGLACAVQGHPRAALDTNDLRIRRFRTQHPVESDCQPACRRHFCHALRLVVAAVLILFAKPFIKACGRLR